TLEAVDGHAAVLSDGDRIPTSTVVWTTGARPNPLLATFGRPLDDVRRVKVASPFRAEGLPNVLALGDCARVPNEATPDRPDPPPSQHALRQPRRLATNPRRHPEPQPHRVRRPS